jgi:tetratricopeptide (TPR) repeat protein
MWLFFVNNRLVSYFIIFCICMLLPCIAAGEKSSRRVNNGPTSVNTDWSQYSWGLYYKNLAAREADASKRDAYLAKALKYFMGATSSGASLARIYLRIAECYFMRNDYKTSLEFAQKSLALDATNVRTFNKIYHIYIKMKNYEAAARILEQCLSAMPDSVQIQFNLAEHYDRYMHDANKAAEAYQKTIAMSEHLPVDDYFKEQSLLGLGHIAFRKGDIAKSASFYREVLKINGDNLEAVYYCALASMEMYDFSGAEAYSNRFLRFSPGNKIINSILGRIYYIRDDIRAIPHLYNSKSNSTLSGLLSSGLYHERVGNDRTAEKYLGGMLKLAPKTISLHIALARIYSRKKETAPAFNEYVTAGILLYNNRLYQEATRCLHKALEINGEVPGAYYYMAKAYEGMRLFSLALYYFKETIRLHPDTDLMLHVGYLYGLRKDYDDAESYFNLASARDPKNSRPFFFKGLVSIWQEDYPSAEKLIRRAISLDDKTEIYYYYLAITMDRQSKLDLAIESLKKAIKNNPKSARAYNYLGYLYADNNMRIDESLNLILKALEIDPGNGAYTDSLGWAYFRKGEYKRALEKLLKAEEILRKENNFDSVVYDHIGDAYLRLGKIDDALKYWTRSTELKKDVRVADKIKKYGHR